MKKCDDCEILLILDSYEDIFSDFDPRPYSEKALSGDFLEECKKASLDKSGKIILNLFMPKGKRNIAEETNIKKRLQEHFFKHFIAEKKEINKIRRTGLAWFFAGSAMVVLTALLDEDWIPAVDHTLLLKILIKIAHPAGWFFMWEGLGKIFFDVKAKMSLYSFYKKMNYAKIYFLNKHR